MLEKPAQAIESANSGRTELAGGAFWGHERYTVVHRNSLQPGLERRIASRSNARIKPCICRAGGSNASLVLTGPLVSLPMALDDQVA